MAPAVYEEQLAAVQALHQLLQRAGLPDQAVRGSTDTEQGNACMAYVRATQHALEANLEFLSEVSPLCS